MKKTHILSSILVALLATSMVACNDKKPRSSTSDGSGGGGGGGAASSSASSATGGSTASNNGVASTGYDEAGLNQTSADNKVKFSRQELIEMDFKAIYKAMSKASQSKQVAKYNLATAEDKLQSLGTEMASASADHAALNAQRDEVLKEINTHKASIEKANTLLSIYNQQINVLKTEEQIDDIKAEIVTANQTGNNSAMKAYSELLDQKQINIQVFNEEIFKRADKEGYRAFLKKELSQTNDVIREAKLDNNEEQFIEADTYAGELEAKLNALD